MPRPQRCRRICSEATVTGFSPDDVTEIYESAREKIADCIVNGRRLKIDGGNYRLCDGNPEWCYKKHCEKQNQKQN